MKNSTKNLVLNTIVCLCMAGFFMYSFQEVALNRMEESFRSRRYQPPILSAFTIIQSKDEVGLTAVNSVEPFKEIEKNKIVKEHPEPKVWVTMGLSWGENAHVHGKDNFPYSEAALRSIQLWHKLTKAKVVMQLVHNETVPSKPLLEYKARLESLGARVSLYQAVELSCVLTSQLVRLLAFQKDFIEDEDVIITADVDAFIMTTEILRPLKKKVSVWIWRYELSYQMGYTFMMPFIGARSKTWKSMLWYNGSLSSMVSHYRDIMDLSSDYTWDVDQHIVSHSIISNKLCSLQKTNKLWAELKLEPEPFPDMKTCWHGSGIFEDCNNKLWSRNAMIRYQGGGCKWWHFYPDEGVNELENKFKEIMGGEANNHLMDKIIQGARTVKKNVMGSLFAVEKVPRQDPDGELDIWSSVAQ